MSDKSTKIRKDSVALREFLDRHTRNEILVIYEKISEGCMVPRYTVGNWVRGMARIPALHKCKIEEIFGEKIFDELENIEK